MGKLALIVLLFSAVSLAFYWIQIRPAQIRHDCSWIKRHTDAVPEKKGLTEKELQAKGMLKVCPTEVPRRADETSFDFYSRSVLGYRACEQGNWDVVEKHKPQKYVPARDWYEQADRDEYNFCLHDKGL